MIRVDTKSGHGAGKPTAKVVSLLILYLEHIHGYKGFLFVIMITVSWECLHLTIIVI